MQHSIQLFLIIHMCIAANMSISMELETSKQPSNILTEITCIKKPQYAQYLHNNNIVISGEDGCSIINPTTNTEVKKLCTLQSEQIAMHPNQTLFALLHYGNTISVYDTKKDDFIWKKTVEGSFKHSLNPYDKVEQIKFNPHDSTVFVVRAMFNNYGESYHDKYKTHPRDYRIAEYNYTTDQDGIINSNFGYNAYTPLITINTAQKEMYIVHPSWITFHPTNIEFSMKNSNAHDSYGRYIKKFCQYNPDGSYITQVDYQDAVYIINSQNPTQYGWFKAKYNKYQREDFKNIQFYSNSILVISSALYIFSQEKDVTKRRTVATHTVLCYWDIHAKKIIYKSELLDPSKTHDFSFSPDKTKVVIALENTCIILPVPENMNERTILFRLFALKNINLKSYDSEIPQDIIQYIAKTIQKLL